MDIKGYGTSTGNALREAYNHRDEQKVRALIRDGKALVASFTPSDKAVFWEAASKAFHTGAILMERQENSSLIALMRAIEDAIAEGKGQ